MIATWRRVTADRMAWFIGVVAVAIYLPGIWWGLPHASSPTMIHGWDVDGVAGVPSLAELHNLFVEPKPDWYVAYPLFHYVVLWIWYVPYLGILFLSGGLSAPSSNYPYGLVDPEGSLAALALIGRLVTLFMAGGVVMSAYSIGKTLWDKSTGILAAMMVMLAGPMVYYARTGNLDVPALFWVTLGMVVIARSLAAGFTVQRGIGLGTFAALSIATKDQTYGVWLPALVALIVIHLRRTKSFSGVPGSNRMAPVLAMGASGMVIYALTSGLLLSPQRFLAHIRFLLDYQKTFYNVVHMDLLRPQTPAGYAKLMMDILEALLEGIGPVLLLLSLVGFYVVWRSTPFTKVLLAMMLGHLVLVILPVRHMQYRYVMFLTVALAFFIARAAALGLRSGATKMAWIGLLMIGWGWLGARGVDLTYQMLFDARYEAGKWLAYHSVQGDQVAYFGAIEQVPPLPRGVRPTRMPSDTSAFEVLQQTQARFVIVAPDWSSDAGMERSRFLPEPVYACLKDGSLGYQRLAQFRTRSWLRPAIKYLPIVNPPVQIFGRDPSATGSLLCLYE